MKKLSTTKIKIQKTNPKKILFVSVDFSFTNCWKGKKLKSFFQKRQRKKPFFWNNSIFGISKKKRKEKKKSSKTLLKKFYKLGNYFSIIIGLLEK